MCPPVPPPAITVPRRALTDLGPRRRARRPDPGDRAAAAPASPCRATLIRMPAAAMVMTSDEPPKEMNGSGIPVTGSTPTTAPTLMRVSAATHATSPRASSAPKRSGDCTAARMPSQMKPTRRPSTKTAPTMPSSSPMTEKMKSVCALGRKPHCACPPPRPAPTRWPDPSPISDCMTW